jgi:protocatechuate 3,4-dioxygenase beta subunit
VTTTALASSPATTRVRVRVSSEAGRPLTEARAALRRPAPTTVSDAGAVPPQQLEQAVGVEASVTADEDGRVEFAEPPVGVALELVVEAPGHAGAVRALAALFAGEARDLGTLTLAREESVRGIVLDELGQPIAGARIHLMRSSRNEFFHMLGSLSLEAQHGSPAAPAVVSDERGRFAFGGAARGACKLIASAPGRLEGFLGPLWVPEDTARELSLVLAPGIHLRGRVVDEFGEPLAEARVAALRARAVTRDQALSVLEREGVSVAPDGTFGLDGLDHSPDTRIVATAPGRTLAARGRLGMSAEAPLVLLPAHAFEGRLVDAQGTPVRDGVVSLESVADEGEVLRAAHVASGPGGAFRFEGLAEGTYRAWVAHGRARQPHGEVWVGPGVPAVEWVVATRPDLVVRVLDDAGAPLCDALVEVEPSALVGAATHARSARTSAAGQAELFGLVPGAWRVRASTGGAPLVSVESAFPVLPAEVELTVPRLGALTVTVVDAAGGPVPGARLQLARITAGGTVGSFEPLGAPIRTDDAGRGTWASLMPGTLHVQALFPTPSALLGVEPPVAENPRSRVAVAVRAGSVTSAVLTLDECVLDLEVRRAGAPQPASVSAAPEDDEQVADLLTAWVVDGPSAWTPTDAGGRARLVLPGPGTYQVFARASVGSPASSRMVRVERGGQRVVLDLASGEVTGVLVRRDGRGVFGARVRLVPSGRLEDKLELRLENLEGAVMPGLSVHLGETLAYSDAAGRFSFRDVPADRYRLLVEHPVHEPWSSEDFTLAAAERREWGEIHLESTCVVRGTVRAEPAHDPARLALVRLVADDGSVVGTEFLAPDGRFQFARLAPGRYRLVAQVADWLKEGDSFELGPERPSEHEIRLP